MAGLSAAAAGPRRVPPDAPADGPNHSPRTFEEGFDLARFRLGFALLLGDGVPRDEAEAAEWLRLFADGLGPDPLSRLVEAYAACGGPAVEAFGAMAELARAARSGHPEAEAIMGRLAAGRSPD